MTHSVFWRTSTRTALPFRRWDAGVVVYNPFSGSTHFLDDVTGEVLMAVLDGPVRETQLLDLVRSLLELPDEDAALEDFHRRLTSLYEVGLIEPVEPC